MSGLCDAKHLSSAGDHTGCRAKHENRINRYGAQQKELRGKRANISPRHACACGLRAIPSHEVAICSMA
eukprot:1177801-Prorocentrum_minimum.AAC.3